MNEKANLWLASKKWVFAALGMMFLIALWWAFRPEKLWVNVKVNEAAPLGANADDRPLYTGLLSSGAHPTSGRASVYRTSDGQRDLRLTDFTTSNGPDVRVVLARSTDADLKQTFLKNELNGVELGPLKANQGNQNYGLPDSADLSQYDAVVIYCKRFHVIFGLAKLEKF